MTKEKFAPSEPALSHPFTQCTATCTDDGRLILMAGDKCGMIFDEQTGVISIFGTEIRFVTEDIKINGKKMKTAVYQTGPLVSPMDQVRKMDQVKE